jgi:hypothetical protein
MEAPYRLAKTKKLFLNNILVVVKLKGRKLNSKGRVPISIRGAIQEEPQLLKISDFSPYGTLLEVLSEDK